MALIGEDGLFTRQWVKEQGDERMMVVDDKVVVVVSILWRTRKVRYIRHLQMCSNSQHDVRRRHYPGQFAIVVSYSAFVMNEHRRRRVAERSEHRTVVGRTRSHLSPLKQNASIPEQTLFRKK